MPSTVTWRSSMHSSSADWVLGEARLISSPTTMLAKTPPGRNSNSRVSWLKTETPVTSEGSRSGVNWMRAHRAVDAAGQRLAEHRLADAGHVLDQQVALGEQHDQGGVTTSGLPSMTRSMFWRTAPVDPRERCPGRAPARRTQSSRLSVPSYVLVTTVCGARNIPVRPVRPRGSSTRASPTGLPTVPPLRSTTCGPISPPALHLACGDPS